MTQRLSRFAPIAWLVVFILIFACISGYKIGKDIALRENAEKSFNRSEK